MPENSESRLIFQIIFVLICTLVINACSNQPTASEQFELLTPATQLEAPPPRIADKDQLVIMRGQYLVEILGCGSCHTQGALEGTPDYRKRLAGSTTGITYSNPLTERFPGVVYPANITPDKETGIGQWSEEQIVRAIRLGVDTQGKQHLPVMPWPAYAKISEQDAFAMAAYLLSIPAVNHRVPQNVLPGNRAKAPFVHFGVYRSRQ